MATIFISRALYHNVLASSLADVPQRARSALLAITRSFSRLDRGGFVVLRKLDSL